MYVTGPPAGPTGFYTVATRKKTLKLGGKKSLSPAVSFPSLLLIKLTIGTGGKGDMFTGFQLLCHRAGQSKVDLEP